MVLRRTLGRCPNPDFKPGGKFMRLSGGGWLRALFMTGLKASNLRRLRHDARGGRNKWLRPRAAFRGKVTLLTMTSVEQTRVEPDQFYQNTHQTVHDVIGHPVRVEQETATEVQSPNEGRGDRTGLCIATNPKSTPT